MSTHRKHHYTFEVTRPAPTPFATDKTQRFHAGAIGTSPADASARVRRSFPTASLLTLSLVQPAGERCGDDRCAVCYPSTQPAVEQ